MSSNGQTVLGANELRANLHASVFCERPAADIPAHAGLHVMSLPDAWCCDRPLQMQKVCLCVSSMQHAHTCLQSSLSVAQPGDLLATWGLHRYPDRRQITSMHAVQAWRPQALAMASVSSR